MVVDILATKDLFEKFASYMNLICAYLVLISTKLEQKELIKKLEIPVQGRGKEFHI